MVEAYLEGITFTLISALIRTYIPNNQIIIVIICIFFYIVVFRDINTNNGI